MDKGRVFRHEKADGNAGHNWFMNILRSRGESRIMSMVSADFLKLLMRGAQAGFWRSVAAAR
jgi:hypothetical protein